MLSRAANHEFGAELMPTWTSRLLGGLKTRVPIRGDFAQNVFRLFAANAAAQLLTFAAYPVLTRLYAPGQLGILTVALVAMLLLSSSSPLRYESRLPLCLT